MPIPLFVNDTQPGPTREAILSRISAVVAAGQFILGPEVRAFEAELADYVGVAHAVGVANGTDALTIAARALGVEAGDEVVLPAFTFYATAEAIASIGARPVFCDVDRDTRNITPETVAAALTPRTKAIVAVDLFGNPAPLPALRELGAAGDRGCRAGARRSPRRSPRRRTRRSRHPLVLSVEEPRVLRRRRRDPDRQRRAGPARAVAPVPRLQGQADVPVDRLQLAARRASGRNPARAAAASSTNAATGADAPRSTTQPRASPSTSA